MRTLAPKPMHDVITAESPHTAWNPEPINDESIAATKMLGMTREKLILHVQKFGIAWWMPQNDAELIAVCPLRFRPHAALKSR